jgi:heat shock protein HslJ
MSCRAGLRPAGDDSSSGASGREPDAADPRPDGMRTLTPLLALVLALAGCAAAVAPSSSAEAIEGAWELTSGRTSAGEIPIVDDWPITLTIEGGTIGGTAACNSYGGRLVGVGGRVRVEELGMTAMGCEADVMASESAYTAALDAVSEIGMDGDALVLVGPDVELRFAELPPPPTAELLGTRWVLETVFVGDVAVAPVGEPATLELRADGTFSGSTGCRTFTGTWVEEGDGIRDTSLRMDGADCVPELVAQDSSVVGVVGDGFVPTVNDDLLTLTDPGGAGLVYRAGE